MPLRAFCDFTLKCEAFDRAIADKFAGDKNGYRSVRTNNATGVEVPPYCVTKKDAHRKTEVFHIFSTSFRSVNKEMQIAVLGYSSGIGWNTATFRADFLDLFQEDLPFFRFFK